ncbi:radical SAM/SPASM domain-containing protein [Brachyspira catarrhinii]|uniref:Radical SAM protein n=1 Tax=Brachyspira catarrhinii TaxID=2528966 RepID=A0ABY2TN68_9SPIR|nr:radical SAM/SPASM domain-containing protein [Brachyspira catarrhinii]TKZ28423.1 radical SAM protein [Brachyspira catarrhinii]
MFYNKYKVNYKYIRMVEIEIFSYCNRKCWFCPNSFIDRNSTNILMLEELYLKILNELKSINYSNMISYSRYNEPTSNREIFIKRLKQAKAIIPNATLHTNTNGDFLTRDYLDELYEAGLKSMNIQSYLSKDEIFNANDIKIKVGKMAEKLGLDFIEKINTIDRYEIAFKYKDMNLNMYARDFRLNGNNRGGVLDTIPAVVRKYPCYIPFTDIYIDYNGKVLPCCNFRSDIKEHNNFILGDANNESILYIFNNIKMKKLRKKLLKDIDKLKPCNECNFAIDYKPYFMSK